MEANIWSGENPAMAWNCMALATSWAEKLVDAPSSRALPLRSLSERLYLLFRDIRDRDRLLEAVERRDHLFPARETIRQRSTETRFDDAVWSGSCAGENVNLSHGVAGIRKAKRRITPRTIADAQRAATRHNADVVSFPRPTQKHETRQMQAAARVKERRAPKPLTAAEQQVMNDLNASPAPASNVQSLKTNHTPEDRFARAKRFEQRIAEGEKLADADALWLTGYQAGPEYRALDMIHEDFDCPEQVPPAS